MEQILKIESIAQVNSFIGQETLHPLVSIIDFSKAKPFRSFKSHMGIYTIFLKDVKCGDMTYGCNHYDYEDGTLIFIAPGQIYGIDSNEEYMQARGHALIFHPDL